MQPHHEAAAMSHEIAELTHAGVHSQQQVDQQLMQTLTVSRQSIAAQESSNEKKMCLESTSDVETGTIVTVREEKSLFEIVYKRTMLVFALLSIPLFLKLIMAPVASQEWIDANLYLAVKAYLMTTLHTVAMIYRLILRSRGCKREQGSTPWVVDGMYALFHATCLALHYWCAQQGVMTMNNDETANVLVVEVVSLGFDI